MEMQFDRVPVPYLKKLADGVRTQEETLEVRLPEGMPDIGRVLGAWGQVIVRGKEWNPDEMTLSCGVMVWVLYTPEDGEQICSVEAWLPFTMKWDLPETPYDGKIVASCMLKGVDARSTAARKLLVRAVLCAAAQGLESAQAQLAVPGELPADIRLLTAEYPVTLPRETGEKAFVLEEQLPVSNRPKPEKLVYYTLQPEITDQKVMAGKAVFRGIVRLHLLYQGAEQSLCTWDHELPFSQYADLDGAYSQDAELQVVPCVTALDLSLTEDGQLQLKAGILSQYLLSDRSVLAVAEDAYSPVRKLEPAFEPLKLPALLDRVSNVFRIESTAQAEARQVVDVTAYPACSYTAKGESGLEISLPGQFQMLYYDMAGQLRSMLIPWEERWSIAGSEDNTADIRISAVSAPQVLPGAGSVTLRADMTAAASVSAGQGLTMLVGMDMSDAEKPDPNRPSLILCRKGNRRLWDLAKENGSTVEAILTANGPAAEQEENPVLLIPVV